MACRSSPTGKPPPTLQRQPHTANNTQAVSSPRQEGTEAAGSSWHLACLHQDSLSSDCSVFPCDVSEVTEIPGSALCHHHFLKTTDSRSPAAFQVPASPSACPVARAMHLSPLNTHGHMNTHGTHAVYMHMGMNTHRYTHTCMGTHVERQAHMHRTGVVLKRLGGAKKQAPCIPVEKCPAQMSQLLAGQHPECVCTVLPLLPWRGAQSNRVTSSRCRGLAPPSAGPAHLHPLQGLGLAGGSVDEVDVLHVLRDPLQEAQGLVEGDGHRDLGQLLEGQRGHHRRFPESTAPGLPHAISHFLEQQRLVGTRSETC